ncbi:MAG: ATP-binding cassette domain-containing protein [Eggerthellaceae bacterium]|nr:ATP-binding cassette domain-containing protein [Eggerthellaceae bacterium]
MNVVETCGLTKVYGRWRVVDDLNMHVRQGDVYGFVGKNGAGKSTVMKMICGLVTPTSGSVKLFGEEAAGSPRTGALIEAPGVLPRLSVSDNLMAKALALGIPGARSQCDRVISLVGLEAAADQKARKLSLGMRQRLGIALALIGSPDLLILDEPLNGLDAQGTRSMRNLIISLNQTLGVTFIISSHVFDQLDRMATRYGVIAQGRLVREATAEQVQAECEDSLRIRTENPARTLAMLQEELPAAAFRAEPDGALVVTRYENAQAVSEALHRTGQVVLELSTHRRDLEEYFLNLMDEGERHV